jgi:hypothetical protein
VKGRPSRLLGCAPTFGTCPVCERPFPSRYALKRHVELAACTTADRAPKAAGGAKGGA